MTTHDEEPGVASCAICLTHQSLEEAYLDGCFHRFCLPCIARWTESQRQHPPSGNAPPFACPLCKTPYASVLHDYRHHSYKRQWVAQPGAGGGGLPDGAAVELTPLQRRRRARYFSPRSVPSGSGSGSGAATLTAVQAARPEVAVWIRRELETLMLDSDVGMVVAHIGGTLRSVAGGAPKQRRGVVSTAGASREAVVAAVKAAAQPYVFEHAGHFGQELVAFAASGRSIAAHDKATDMAAGGSGKRAAMTAVAAAAADDGSRESGELSPTQSADSSDSGGGAAAADEAVSRGDGGSGTTAADAAAAADAGSGRQCSPSPDRGSDCLSLSVGSEFGDSDSEAYLPLVQASAAAQRRKLEAAAAGAGADQDAADGHLAEDSANSPPCSGWRSSQHEPAPAEHQDERKDAAASSRRRQGTDADANTAARAGSSRRQHMRQRKDTSSRPPPPPPPPPQQQQAKQPGVPEPAAAASAGEQDAAAAEAAAERLRRRAEKFGTLLPPPGQPAPAAKAPAPSSDGRRRRDPAAINGNGALRRGGGDSSSMHRQAGAQHDGSSPRRRDKSLKLGQLRPFVNVEAAPARPAALESPIISRPLQPQGGSEAAAAAGDEGVRREHRKRLRRLRDSQGNIPAAGPDVSRDQGTPCRGASGAMHSPSDAAQGSRKRRQVDSGSSGGALRMFRSALAAEASPPHSKGSSQRPGQQTTRVSAVGTSGLGSSGVSGGGGGGGSAALEQLRLRALAAHAGARP